MRANRKKGVSETLFPSLIRDAPRSELKIRFNAELPLDLLIRRSVFLIVRE